MGQSHPNCLVPAGAGFHRVLLAGLLCVGGLVGLNACGTGAGETTVAVCGNLDVPGDVDAVRVAIYDQNHTPLRQGVLDLWVCPGPNFRALPQTVDFEGVDGDVIIEVQGLKDGAPVIRSQLRTTMTDEGNEATVSLEKSCLGSTCADGETCVNGHCEQVALAARATSQCSVAGGASSSKGSVDAGTGSHKGSSAGMFSTELCPSNGADMADVDSPTSGSPGGQQ